MTASKFNSLSEDQAIKNIVDTVRKAKKGKAPFALVLGSGFSYGLVPTVREVITEALPLWMKSLEDEKPYEELKKQPQDRRLAIAQEFWQKFVTENDHQDGFKLTLNSNKLPDKHADAYKAAFNTKYGCLKDTGYAREFQRALMQLDKPRLNAAHFLLASLLGVQPGKSRSSDLFRAKAAFSRLILTTNFDPFLQIALQAVNRLYFMSDTPRLGVSSEIYDEDIDAIHLVYLHGSVHRRFQAANPHEIDKIKKENARRLAPVLERHGVIILGYSGWDDAIVEALDACEHFDHQLYWCGRQSDPLAEGVFGERVPDILRKPATNYVWDLRCWPASATQTRWLPTELPGSNSRTPLILMV
jgi:hypothetical protein